MIEPLPGLRGFMFWDKTICSNSVRGLNGHLCRGGHSERHGGSMVTVLDSRSRIRVQALAGVIVLCSWSRHYLTLTVPLSTQEYKWVPAFEPSGKADEMLRGYLGCTSIPSRRSSNTPSRFMLQKPG